MTSYGPVQWSKTASLNSSADVNVLVGPLLAPSATNDQFRSIMQSFSKFRDDNNGTLVSGGSTTAATLATNQVFTALKTGLTVAFGLAGTLDTSATLNVDGLGAAHLQTSYGTNITTGQLNGGTIIGAAYVSSGTVGSTTPPAWVVVSAIQGGTGSLMTPTGTDQKVSGGAKTPCTTISCSTTVQIDYGKGPMQYVPNGGTFVLKAPAADGYCSLLVKNNALAGTITTSGFSVSSFTGDAVTTVNGYSYVWSLMTINGTSTYMIKALQ